MKIRWYHWLVYKIWRYYWNPILSENKELRHELLRHIAGFDKKGGLTEQCVKILTEEAIKIQEMDKLK
jgi:hypothetical protein